jgi:hypothetical protein
MDDDFFRSVFGKRGGFGDFGGFGPFGNNNMDQFHSELHKMLQEMEQAMRETHPFIIEGLDKIPPTKELPSIEWPAEDEKAPLRDGFLKPSLQPNGSKNEVEPPKIDSKKQEPVNPGFGLRSGIVNFKLFSID